MTDEQVQQIVNALQGSSDVWSTVGIPLGSALFGALLTLGLQWLTDRKRKNDAFWQARGEAAKSASVLAARFAMTPGHAYATLMLQSAELLAPVRVELVAMDPSQQVAKWWSRQMVRAGRKPADGKTFSRAEFGVKGEIAYSVHRRLALWAEAEIAPSEFAPENDAAWDEKAKALRVKK